MCEKRHKLKENRHKMAIFFACIKKKWKLFAYINYLLYFCSEFNTKVA